MTRTRTAFTLLELLVAIAVVMLLVVIVTVSLKTLRGSADRTRSLQALRNMSLAYSSYTTDHKMRLMPGYARLEQFIPTTLPPPLTPPCGALGLSGQLPDGTALNWQNWDCGGNVCDGSSYVWRLSPYADHAWMSFFTDLRDRGTRSRIQVAFDEGHFGPSNPGSIPGGLSERPSFGMNSIFVGGDIVHGGDYVTDRNPWCPDFPDDVLAATRLSEVKNPRKLIVFAPAARAGQGPSGEAVYEEPELGFCELRPPYLEFDQGTQTWIQGQWKVGQRGLVEHLPTIELDAGCGLPIDRIGSGVVPVSNLDGSADLIGLPELWRDMTRWSPREFRAHVTGP
jgi:type II secretory pathway pseudopilin PulG